MNLFEKDYYLNIGRGRPIIKTIDGVNGVKEAIKFLKYAKPV